MGYNNRSLSIDATIMVSKNCPAIGEHVFIIFVTQKVSIATVLLAKNTLNYSFRGLYFKNSTMKFFYTMNI